MHILKLSIFIIVVGGITGIKPEDLSPLLLFYVKGLTQLLKYYNLQKYP